jgi:hypothetical protein
MHSTSLIGAPSSQCACSGQVCTAVVKQSAWRNAFNGLSSVVANRVTDHVSLSLCRVSRVKLPIGLSAGTRRQGRAAPVKYRV